MNKDRWRQLMVTVGLAAGCVAGAAGPVGAVIDDPEVETSASYEYLVDTKTSTIDITIALKVTADKPNRSTNTGVYEYYFKGFMLPIPKGSRDVTVSDGGVPLNITVDTTADEFDLLEIEFRRNIYYRQTADLVISFALPPGGPRTDQLARVNDAYVGFESWVAPTLEQAEVTIVTPAGFDDHSFGSDTFLIQAGDGQTRFRASDVDPENYWSVVSLSRRDALTSTEVSVDGHDLRIRSWPGDVKWTRHVNDNLDEGLATLIDTVGMPWPVVGELTIVESYSPYLLGYGGWYDPSLQEIEIGDELDDHVVFHELSHVWFNDSLFTKRWIIEGLANEIGASVVESIGGDMPELPRSSMLDSAAQPLNGWYQGGDDWETEAWSYGASWTVTHEIGNVIGLDALSLVIQAAADGEIAYLGDSDQPEPGRRSKDWRLYLDLIENRGQVADDRITDLFADWVLTSLEVGELVPRADARLAYDALEVSGGDWAPPLAVRTAMSDWRFTTAAELIEASQSILDQRSELEVLMADLDGSVPAELEVAYESAATDLTAAADAMGSTLDTARRLDETRRHIAGADGVLQRIGAIGQDFDEDLGGAVASFEAGDGERAIDQAETIDRQVDGLSSAGAVRLGSTVVGLLIAAGAGVFVRRRTKGSMPPSPPMSDPEESAVDPVAVSA